MRLHLHADMHNACKKKERICKYFYHNYMYKTIHLKRRGDCVYILYDKAINSCENCTQKTDREARRVLSRSIAAITHAFADKLITISAVTSLVTFFLVRFCALAQN
jgi:hypothetical protein